MCKRIKDLSINKLKDLILGLVQGRASKNIAPKIKRPATKLTPKIRRPTKELVTQTLRNSKITGRAAAKVVSSLSRSEYKPLESD